MTTKPISLYVTPIRLLFHLLLLIPFAACTTSGTDQASGSQADISFLLADTISYPVIIKNPDAFDTWTEDCLKALDRQKLVDKLFDAVYKNKAQAYSYLSHHPMSVQEVRDIEAKDDFKRDRVGKLQFWESWYFDETSQVFEKKVHAVLMAYEVYTPEGELRNYKAAFYIKTNHP